ncbi:MAG TPA: hypothetical protein VLF59_00610 [Candidatus Saccharimonadales bacterium]|nr:hypothetical protein [Candidatus Saccharimonadales bacterium]
MSRVLAQLMGTAEPTMRTQLQRLEQAAGLPGADIRLMMQIINETRAKIRELGLDPQDTTGPELYHTLQIRLQEDEARIRTALGLDAEASAADVITACKTYLSSVAMPTQSFVVKQPAMRALLKKLQPKTTMKRLGYRSMDSMLKHEPLPQLLAAASMIEPTEWQRKRLEAYKKLKTSNFEVRAATFLAPSIKHWPDIAAAYTEEFRHNIITLPELGAIVLLPIQQDMPGLAITTLTLAVQSINDIRALGSYLKLQQVRPDFGTAFAACIQNEPMAATELAGESLPWKVVQWFYGHGHSAYHPDAFEPHVQPEDLAWHEAEDMLVDLHPAMEFWQGGQLLALLDEGQPVSLNLLDVALGVCNKIEYANRIVHHMRTTLGRELLARYLHQDNLHALLLGKLDAQLAPEIAFD